MGGGNHFSMTQPWNLSVLHLGWQMEGGSRRVEMEEELEIRDAIDLSTVLMIIQILYLVSLL